MFNLFVFYVVCNWYVIINSQLMSAKWPIIRDHPSCVHRVFGPYIDKTSMRYFNLKGKLLMFGRCDKWESVSGRAENLVHNLEAPVQMRQLAKMYQKYSSWTLDKYFTLSQGKNNLGCFWNYRYSLSTCWIMLCILSDLLIILRIWS